MEPMQLEGAGPALAPMIVRASVVTATSSNACRPNNCRMTCAAVGVLVSGARGACSVCASSTQGIAESSNGLQHVVCYRARCTRVVASVGGHHVHHAECAPSAIACGIGLTNVARVELS